MPARPPLTTVRTPLTRGTAAALRRSLGNYAGDVSRRVMDDLLDEVEGTLLSVLNPQQVARDGVTGTVTEGYNPATARQSIREALDKLGIEGFQERIDFAVKTSTEVARGAGRFVRDLDDTDVLPAWELVRQYDRKEPRLWRGDEGTEDKSLGSGFASRWYQAAQISGDVDAARMLIEHDRMIALKSSGIWQALGSEFDDSLGNPFPPFAFNSGMEVDEISHKECVDLGLLDEGEEVAAHGYDLENLFAPISQKEAA